MRSCSPSRFPPTKRILRRADPALRDDIVFPSAKRDRAEIERDSDRIIAAMQGTPGAWAGGYDVKSGKFAFDVTGEAGVAYAKRNVPPDLRDDVIIRVGPVPVPLAKDARNVGRAAPAA